MDLDQCFINFFWWPTELNQKKMTRNIKLFLILFFGLLVFFVLLEGLKKPNKYSPDGNKVKIDFNLKFTNLYDNKEIFFGDTIKDTIKDIDEVGVAKAMILTWYSEKGYTDLNVTNENFTPDMENFDSLYVKT